MSNGQEHSAKPSAAISEFEADALSPEWEVAIRGLLTDYWLRADYCDPRPPEQLFTEDCEFKLGNLTFRGRPMLADFFSKRRAENLSVGRTTRHLSAGFRARKLGVNRVSATTTVLAFAGFGEWPIETSLPSIADFEDICVLQADQGWLFESRNATSVFAGPQAPRFAVTPRGGAPAAGEA